MNNETKINLKAEREFAKNNRKVWDDKIEAIDKEIEAMEKPKFNEPWKPEKGENLYYNSHESTDWKATTGVIVVSYSNTLHIIDNGNCFKTFEQAEQREKKLKGYNLLKNFSDANGGDEIDWDSGASKFYIVYDNTYTFKTNAKITTIKVVETLDDTVNFMTVYFKTKEIANEALRRYRKELEELVCKQKEKVI